MTCEWQQPVAEFPTTADPPVELRNETLAEVFLAAVSRWGTREALVDVPSGRRWTWAELGAEVELAARALLAAGVAPGERVGVWTTNVPEWVVLHHAVARIGAVLVPLDPAYGLRELEAAVERVEMAHLFTQTPFKDSDYPVVAAEVMSRSGSLRGLHVIGEDSWEQFLAAGAGVAPEAVRVPPARNPDAAAVVLFTSGTAGPAKGVVLSSRALVNGAWVASSVLDCDERDRYCLSLGLGHVFALAQCVLPPVLRGACLVVPAPVFDAEQVLAAVESERCTVLHGVPTMFLAALTVQEDRSFDLTSLRTGVCGAAAVGASLMRRVVERLHLPELVQGYGMTETAGAATTTRTWMPFERRVASAGRPLPHSAARVVDTATGLEVAAGEHGELQLRGYLLMQGYWGQPDATAAVFTSDGWMRTGDLAVVDADGDVRLLGRMRDVIVRGGEKIAPDELREFFAAMPDVADAEVVGIPDELLGQQVMLWIAPKRGYRVPSLTEVQERCRGRIARYKVPVRLGIVDELPVNSNGKVSRSLLREWGAAAVARSREAARGPVGEPVA